jgi:hypothetical protein
LTTETILLQPSSRPAPWAQLRVIPLISLTDREELWHFWPEVSYPAIAINYLSLKKRTRLYRIARERGIKEALDFDGTVISVLVGDNWALDHTPVQRYHYDLTQMGFDAATTHDDYAYWSNHRNYRYHRIRRLLSRARQLIESSPEYDVIGIVKGTTPDEIEFCIDNLYDMGISKTAFPCSEVAFEKRLTDIYEYMRLSRDHGRWSWLIGVGSLHLMKSFDADCFSSSKWCYSATYGYKYTRDRVRQGPVPANCHHEVCQMHVDKGSPRDVTLARHNISTLIEIQQDMGVRSPNGWR